MEARADTTTNAGQLLAAASGGRRQWGDRIFSNFSVAAAVTILALLAGVAAFLLIQAAPAITASSSELPGGKSLLDYIAPLAFGTVLAATIAVILAVPLAVAVALFNGYANPENERYMRDVLAPELPGIPITLSSDLSRQWREHERPQRQGPVNYLHHFRKPSSSPLISLPRVWYFARPLIFLVWLFANPSLLNFQLAEY